MHTVVAHTGFEPVISTLRGWCPRPLDECATDVGCRRRDVERFGGSAYGIRTRDLHLERVVSLAPRRMRYIADIERWLGIEDSNLGLQIQSLSSYR